MDAGIQHVVEEREKAIAEGLREVATELRLIDVIEFVTYIRLDKTAHLETLINAACECHFRPGTMTFGASADVHIDWGAAPTVWLDMKFANQGFVVYFSLALESCRAGVEISYMTVGGGNAEDPIHTAGLAAAIQDARIWSPLQGLPNVSAA